MSQKFYDCCVSNIQNIIDNKDSCWSLAQLCALIGYSDNGRNTTAMASFCKEQNIDISHFTRNGRPPLTDIEKTCPECGNTFTVSKYNIKGDRQKTCSHACANKFFKQASKEDSNTYAIKAKNAGMTSCCVCGESQVLDIHHLDQDRNNNELDNLIPLCPTHHAYIHRGKQDLIFEKIVLYLDKRCGVV